MIVSAKQYHIRDWLGKCVSECRYSWTVTAEATQAKEAGEQFAELVRLMTRLRAPGGCPWDRKQTFDTIKPYLLEETYEVMDAIDQRDWAGLTEELGDLLLQPVFFATMGAEENKFTITDALLAINQKLVRRHPHVFADAKAETPDDVKQRWDEIKKSEKAAKAVSSEKEGLLQSVPRNLPALVEAEKIGQKAAAVGFEWPDVTGVLAKVEEEARELAEAHNGADATHMEHELGDLLFTIVSLARFLKVDPEQALRKANGRFRKRFGYIESRLQEHGRQLQTTPLDRLEELWQEAKRDSAS